MGPTTSTLSQDYESQGTMNVLIVGLKGVGKSLILNQLRYDDHLKSNTSSVNYMPNETIKYKDIRFTFWEADGRHNSPEVLVSHLDRVQAIAFVVDSTNREEIEDARYELLYFMCLQTTWARDAAFLIWANKSDLPYSMSADLIRDQLKLSNFTGKVWHVQLCSALNGQGIYEGLDWILSQQQQRIKNKK